MRSLGWVVTLMLAAAPLTAQEPPAPDAEAQEEEEARPEPRHRIRVLQHPYDLASFYRSHQGNGFYEEAPSRYPIAGFYRNHQTSPYDQFWATGYDMRDRGGRSTYRRRIGDNGDLYFFAPALLGLVGPLSDAFLEPR